MQPNNTLERTRGRRGRFVLAMEGVLAEAESRRWCAAQLDRLGVIPYRSAVHWDTPHG